MKLAIIIISFSLLLNNCQLLKPLDNDKYIGLYPQKNIKIKNQQKWQQILYTDRITDFKKRPIGFKKIVFLGNSITEGAKSWNKRFNFQNLVNRGISGDITEGVLARLNEIHYYEPIGVFLLIGINDIFDANILNRDKITAKYVANNILKITENIQKKSNYTKIYIQTILPVNLIQYNEIKGTAPIHEIDLNEQIKQINLILKNNINQNENPNIHYIDLHMNFVDENGLLNSNLSSDGIHLNQQGYDLWVNLIKNDVNDLNKLFFD